MRCSGILRALRVGCAATPPDFVASREINVVETGQSREESQPYPTTFQSETRSGGVPVDNRMLSVPLSLLLDPDLVASAKVIWIALRHHPSAGPAELRSRTGLSRQTIQAGLDRARAYRPAPGGPNVRLPARLLREPGVGGSAKVLYGLLQAIPSFRSASGEFTYAALREQTRMGIGTLKKGIGQLEMASWIQTSRATRLSPIRFTLGSPALRRGQAEVIEARRRLKRAKYGGEAIMQEYLSLLIDSDQFTDNARPGFLINPLTGERLELDRFYPPNVAFEYHGAQHFGATDRFTQAEADAQHVRDLIKAGICLYRGIHLVIITAEDLTLEGMIRKIGQSMPLRSLAGREPLIDLLEEASLIYRAGTRRRGAHPAGVSGSEPE